MYLNVHKLKYVVCQIIAVVCLDSLAWCLTLLWPCTTSSRSHLGQSSHGFLCPPPVDRDMWWICICVCYCRNGGTWPLDCFDILQEIGTQFPTPHLIRYTGSWLIRKELSLSLFKVISPPTPPPPNSQTHS